MGAYTNVTIPDRYNAKDSLMRDHRVVKLERDMALEEVRYLSDILDNIPRAVKEYGYVDISGPDKNDKITLIEKKSSNETISPARKKPKYEIGDILNVDGIRNFNCTSIVHDGVDFIYGDMLIGFKESNIKEKIGEFDL